MISIFRKIRQKLLSQNRVMRYLVYALGEILLVVIGILIALQVNTWNEHRKNQETEQKLLKALLQEFESNLEILDAAIALNESNISNSICLGDFTGPSLGNFDEKYLSDLLLGVFEKAPHFFPNQGTIEEIINSGRLSIISDQNLRKAISSWQSELDRVKSQEDFVSGRRNIAMEFQLKNGNFRRHLQITEVDSINTTPSKFPKNDFSFLENQEFESQLYVFVIASKNLSQTYYIPLKIKIEAISDLIRTGIN